MATHTRTSLRLRVNPTITVETKHQQHRNVKVNDSRAATKTRRRVINVVVPTTENRWLSFVRSHRLLPIPALLSKSHVLSTTSHASLRTPRRRMIHSSRPLPTPRTARDLSNTMQWTTLKHIRCYRILLKSIDSIRIPHSMHEQIKRQYHNDSNNDNDNDNGGGVQCQIRLSIFHEPSKRFLGRTWISPSYSVKTSVLGNKPDVVIASVKFEHAVYFRSGFRPSAVVAAECYGVMEVELLLKHKGVATQNYGVGWTTFPLFSPSLQNINELFLPEMDISRGPRGPRGHSSSKMSQTTDGIMAGKISTVSLYAGSPRLLLFGKALKHTSVSQCTVSYSLCKYPALIRTAHLFRDNEFLGQNDLVGGLPFPSMTLPLLPHKLVSVLPLPFVSISVIHPIVSLPRDFDSLFVKQLSAIRTHRWSNRRNGASS